MSAPIPFRASLEPLLADSRRELEDHASRFDVFSQEAVDDLVEALGAVLSRVLTPPLLDWFLEHPGRNVFDPTSTAAHDDFVAEMASGGLEEKLDRLPRLAELVEHHRAAWLDRATKVIERTEADRAVLAARFGVHPPIVSARGLVAGASATLRHPKKAVEEIRERFTTDIGRIVAEDQVDAACGFIC